jgi:hypothetical protein
MELLLFSVVETERSLWTEWSGRARGERASLIPAPTGLDAGPLASRLPVPPGGWRGNAMGSEQGTDQCLQLLMLRHR